MAFLVLIVAVSQPTAKHWQQQIETGEGSSDLLLPHPFECSVYHTVAIQSQQRGLYSNTLCAYNTLLTAVLYDTKPSTYHINQRRPYAYYMLCCTSVFSMATGLK